MKRRFTIIFALLIVAGCIALFTWVIAQCYMWGACMTIDELQQNSASDREISSRLQVTPSWDAIRHYLFVEFKPGMPRDEVHNLLDKVGPWEISFVSFPTIGTGWYVTSGDGLYQEDIRFTEQYTYRALKYWVFYYDKDGYLVEQEPVDIP
jgi:hypothetical protein